MEAVGVQYNKLRDYCGWLETDIATRRLNKQAHELMELRGEVQGLLRRSNAYLGRLEPESRPGLQLVGGSDDA